MDRTLLFIYLLERRKKNPLNLGNKKGNYQKKNKKKKENYQNARMKDDGPLFSRRAS